MSGWGSGAAGWGRWVVFGACGGVLGWCGAGVVLLLALGGGRWG